MAGRTYIHNCTPDGECSPRRHMPHGGVGEGGVVYLPLRPGKTARDRRTGARNRWWRNRQDKMAENRARANGRGGRK
jgi:hypothetical protein